MDRGAARRRRRVPPPRRLVGRPHARRGEACPGRGPLRVAFRSGRRRPLPRGARGDLHARVGRARGARARGRGLVAPGDGLATRGDRGPAGRARAGRATRVLGSRPRRYAVPAGLLPLPDLEHPDRDQPPRPGARGRRTSKLHARMSSGRSSSPAASTTHGRSQAPTSRRPSSPRRWAIGAWPASTRSRRGRCTRI